MTAQTKAKPPCNVKAQNRKAQLVFEREDGSLDERPEELPFDLSADVIEITDADYAIWYMDCMDNPKKYEGKKYLSWHWYTIRKNLKKECLCRDVLR